jgi:hypothetical protein
LFNGLERLLEEIVVQFLELGAGKSLGEVLAGVERFDFDLGGLLGRAVRIISNCNIGIMGG